MSIFDKPITQLSSKDVEDLLSQQAVENVRLEFKVAVPGKDETLKKLSSFANTFGGFIVVGAEANSSDGRIVGLPGVDIQPGYRQTVVQWCFDGAAPPLTVEVSDPIPCPGGTGKVCYVLYTAESELAPHFLNGRKGVYVRTDEFSARFEARLATENELLHLFERRKLILDRRSELVRRARHRFDTFVERRYREVSGGQQSIGCRFHFCVVPRFPAQPLCEHTRLLSLLKTKTVNWRQRGFPRDPSASITQHESVVVLRPGSSFSILEANVWGMLYYAAEIQETRQDYCGIHLNQFLGHVLVFIRHASLVLQELGYQGALNVESTLQGMRGVPWIYFQWNFPERGPESELDDEASFSITTTSEALSQRPDGFAMDVLRYAFFAMNWPGAADSPEKLAELVRADYVFNRWDVPEVLRV